MGQTANLFRDGPADRPIPYLLFLPEEKRKNPRRKWPVILFLHGGGERGSNPEILKRHGIPKMAEGDPAFPFIAISPQCPARSAWGPHLDTVESLLNSILESYAGDAERVYLTGMSMGGNGVWSMAARYPRKFAAAAPICGYGLRSEGFPQKVCVLNEMPVWAFHGEDDDIIPVFESRILVKTLKACGGRVRFTVYPGVGHDSWTKTYDDPRLYRWFLRHSLPGKLRPRAPALRSCACRCDEPPRPRGLRR